MSDKVSSSKVFAIILAAGSGRRMGSSITKQRMLLLGKSVLRRAAEAFDLCNDVDGIIVVARDDETELIRLELEGCINKLYSVVSGGKTRAESAIAGFNAVPEGTDIVAIHDAARCLILPEDISEVIACAASCGAATAVTTVIDTVKKVDESGRIVGTVDRSSLRRTQTPQVFTYELYKRAAASASDELLKTVTDDCMLMEAMGVDVYTVEVGGYNIKITTAEDISIAECILNSRR